MSRARVRSHVVLLFTLAIVATLGRSATHVAATTNPLDVHGARVAGPILTGAACTGHAAATLIVTGEQFTPGGEADVMLYLDGRAQPAVSRSLRASASISSPNRSADPARGYQHGGFIGIALGHWCEQTALVRAYDRQKMTWSNPVPVDQGCD